MRPNSFPKRERAAGQGYDTPARSPRASPPPLTWWTAADNAPRCRGSRGEGSSSKAQTIVVRGRERRRDRRHPRRPIRERDGSAERDSRNTARTKRDTGIATRLVLAREGQADLPVSHSNDRAWPFRDFPRDRTFGHAEGGWDPIPAFGHGRERPGIRTQPSSVPTVAGACLSASYPPLDSSHAGPRAQRH